MEKISTLEKDWDTSFDMFNSFLANKEIEEQHRLMLKIGLKVAEYDPKLLMKIIKEVKNETLYN